MRAKPAVELAALFQDEVVEDAGRAQWCFAVPKMLRVYFLHHRELLGALSLLAYETVKELMAAAAMEEEDFQPGAVPVVQSFGDMANFHPRSSQRLRPRNERLPHVSRSSDSSQ